MRNRDSGALLPVGILALLLVGFWLRLSFLLGLVFHVDEFISMLAANMVAQRGLPILPSGLFYDHGLLVSFLSGALIALVGFTEQIARWPVLLISVFTIAAFYVAGWRLFDSRVAGLLAATLSTFSAASIIWGTRARMYAPAHLFVTLSLTFLLEGTLKNPNQRSRYLALACLVAALLSHTITFAIVPPLVILVLLFSLVYRREPRRNGILRNRDSERNGIPRNRDSERNRDSAEWGFRGVTSGKLWQEAVIGLMVVGAVLAIASMGQMGSTVSLQDPGADAAPPLGLEFLRGFFSLGLERSRFDNLIGFFDATEYRWLLPIIALSLLVALFRVLRRAATFADIALLFLALFSALVIFEMGAVLTDTWSLSRYLFFLVLPGFFLLAAGSMARVLGWLGGLLSKLMSQVCVSQVCGAAQGAAQVCVRDSRRGAWLGAAAPTLGLVLIIVTWGPAAWDLAHSKGTGDYHTAFAYLRENWQPGDRVMTFHAAAAYLYLGRCDYYANQVTAKVLQDEDSDELVDRYSGSPLIDSVEEFNGALAGGGRVWFVVDSFRLFNLYEPFFTQQIFAQMDLVGKWGEVYAFVSRPHPIPLPPEPTHMLDGNYSNLVHLGGYDLNGVGITPDGSVSLGLYWRPIGNPTRALKVFVHVRDGRGQTIAQADHFIYEGLLSSEEWEVLRQKGEWLRDTADLRVPQPLPADGGPYRVFIGLYDPATFERLPVLNDTSGENAVVVDMQNGWR